MYKNAILVLFISDRNIEFFMFFYFFIKLGNCNVYVFFLFTTICISKFYFSKDFDKSISDCREDPSAQDFRLKENYSRIWQLKCQNLAWSKHKNDIIGDRDCREDPRTVFHLTIVLSLFFFEQKRLDWSIT